MSGKTYLYERQSEYWTSRQIEDFFLDKGFGVSTLPVPQNVERFLPADFIFSFNPSVKLFGLQFKALYQNGEDHWPLYERQHLQLQKYRWIYYCLSEMKDASDHRAALHWCRFVDAGFPYQEKLYLGGANRVRSYRKWAAFYTSLVSCHRGELIQSKEHLKELLMAGQDDPYLEGLSTVAADIFLVDFERKQTIHYSPLLRRFDTQ
ncbi:MAG: hypothetical protein M3362_00820 [Acidobacteriota bacterium]|nr:hypothetical protein [Acidobacteriota bacterium]